jgi:hypothetical protein
MRTHLFNPYQRNFHAKWKRDYKHYASVQWEGASFGKAERAGLLKPFGKIKPFARLPIKQDELAIYYFDDRSVFDELVKLLDLKEIKESVDGI